METRDMHRWFCDLAEAEVASFVAAVRGVDPDTPVTTCGAWRLADLVQHTGEIHRWATGMVAEGSRERHSRKRADYPLPPDPADYPDWIAEGGVALLAALRGAGPDTPMWAWGVDQHARFWSRRMAHETAIHRGDAQLCAGVEPEYDPDLAADGIGEFLENLPRGLHGTPTLRGEGERLRLLASDRPDAWTITLTDGPFSWERHPPDGTPANVTVGGAVADLYLLAWGRGAPSDARYTVEGDAGLLDRWRRNSAF